MQIVDQEQRCMHQKLLSKWQLEAVRLFFAELSTNGFLDHQKLVDRLQPIIGRMLHAEEARMGLRTLDSNGDGQIDWNEYLQWLFSRSLRMLHQIDKPQDQQAYLVNLQLEFLIQPFENKFSQVQQNLIQIEYQSGEWVGSRYFLVQDNIQPIFTPIPLLQNQVIILEETLPPFIMLLREIIEQRLPTVFQYSSKNIHDIIISVTTSDVVEHMMGYIIDEKTRLNMLKALTMVYYLMHQLNIKNNVMQLQQAILFYLQDTNPLVVQQTILLLSHMVIWDPSIFIFDSMNLILNVEQTDETALYVGFFLQCLFGRFNQHYLIPFAQQQPMQTSQWLQNVQNFHDTINNRDMQDKIELRDEIYGSLVNSYAPFVTTQNYDQQCFVFMLQMLNSHNQNLQLITLNVIQKSFDFTKMFNYSNLTFHLFLLRNDIVSSLLNMTIVHNKLIRDKAISILFGTLVTDHCQYVLRYLEEWGYLHDFMRSSFQIYNAQTERYYQKMILQSYIRISAESSLAFQILASEQFLPKEISKFIIYAESHHEEVLDEYVYEQLHHFYQSAFNHCYPLIQQQSMTLEQYRITFKGLVPDEALHKTLMRSFCRYLDSNAPAIFIKKNLRMIHTLLTSLTIDQVKIFQMFSSIFDTKESLIYLDRQLQELNQLTDKIEDVLMLIENTIVQGKVVVTVHYNQYNGKQACRVILKYAMNLLEFEKEVENRLQITRPLLYLVIDPQRAVPYKATIINDGTFDQFKQVADNLVQTIHGSMKIPQAIIAVDLLELKKSDCSMKKILELIQDGSKYPQLQQIQDNEMLWFMENRNAQPYNRNDFILKLHNDTNLQYEEIENIYDSIHAVVKYNDISVIDKADFIQYLFTTGLPMRLAQRIAEFLTNSKGETVDFVDFIAFIAIFIQNSNDTAMLKIVFLVYLNERGEFNEDQLTEYIRDMIEITKTEQKINMAQKWAQDLMVKIDCNQDGFMSFYEYHRLLTDERYKVNLFNPLQKTLTSLTNNRIWGMATLPQFRTPTRVTTPLKY